uniref:Formylglycine-generating enzyme, required for sulfatase activity, contains SUMF1/FGE domain n=1 Tax=Candidatus Kentrum sp. LFY TaxID=2126342 RepID=A0A450WA40_9GAMM|nr:MAG: Formylglycine-generating enzyme, required for sulfatase activity, contains SUMF1/FGE domain [Candidatus Kentron sp. LFY]
MTQRPETRCPACFQDKGNATACDHCGWKPGSPPANPLYLPLGTALGDSYVIGKVLGHGGLGITYLAWDRELDTRIAIKEFLPDTMAGRNTRDAQVTIHTRYEEPFRHALQRFREEARILARFQQHPGIVSVYRFLAANGTGYMAMEFVAGVTLRQYLEAHDNRIPWPKALGLLAPVMDTLDRIHDQGLLHRDIAPDNIYITHDGKLKLLDFGAAREVTGERSVTLSVVHKGGYAPEEQYRTKARQGPWTDVYALSATLYRTVTGQLPPTALDRLHDDDLRPPSALGVAIPEDHEAVLLKGLAIHARDRWQGVGEMRRAWQPKPETVVEPPEPETPEVQPPRPDTYAKYGLWIALFTAVITALMLILELTDKIDLWSDGSDHEPTVHDPVVLLAENSATRGRGTSALEDSTSGTVQRGDSGAAAPESDISGSIASAAGNASDNPPPRAPSLGRLNQTENLSSSVAPSSESQRQAPDAILEDLEADGASRGDNIPRAVPDPAPAGPLPATLLVTVSDPPDAIVTLNDKRIDPNVSHELVAGEYSLRVTSPGHVSFQETIRLVAGDEQRRSIRLEPLPARVIVRSNVTGDTVFIDGEAVGATGPDPHRLAPGEYAIRVEKEGFETFETRVTVAAGGQETVRARLKEDPAVGRTLRDSLASGGRGPEMMGIPGGCFDMGSPGSEKNRRSDERRHRVCVEGFYVGKYEVTFQEYDRFARATDRVLPGDRGWGRGRRPVIDVSWNDATAYVEWLSRETGERYRLPTEVEWEYAARAGTTTPFSTGECITTDQANYDGNTDYADCGTRTGVYRRKTVPVGTFPANPWGLHNVHGNVWEWTCSLYKRNYDGNEKRCASKEVDLSRVVRGGSWVSVPRVVRSANRNRFWSDVAGSSTGFRLAREF